MVAELIVRALPPLNREDTRYKGVQDNVISKSEKTIQDDSTSLLAGKQKNIPKGGTFPKEIVTGADAPPQEKVSMLSLNMIGVVLATIFITMTPKIFSLPRPPPPSS
jgi:hypothetical protein